MAQPQEEENGKEFKEGEEEQGDVDVDPDAETESEGQAEPDADMGDDDEGDEDGNGSPSQSATEMMAELATWSKDNDALVEPALGNELASNFKAGAGFKGFTNAFQDYFFPFVDDQSGILFELVQGLERAVANSALDVLRIHGPVEISPNALQIKTGGPEISIRVLYPSEPLLPPQISASGGAEDGVAVAGPSSASSPPHHDGGVPLAVSTPEVQTAAQRAELAAAEKQITPAERAFSKEKLEALQKPLRLGWKREIVIRSHGGGASKKLGDVYYFSPAGIKYRSSKQVALLLQEENEGGLSTENFSFAKARVSYNPEQESVRAAHGGRNLNPVKHPPSARSSPAPRPSTAPAGNTTASSSSGVDADSTSNEEVKRASSRRSIQPPKRYANSAPEEPSAPKRSKFSGSAADYCSSTMEMGMLPPKYKISAKELEEKSGEQMLAEYRARKAAALAAGHGQGQGQRSGSTPLFGLSALTAGADLSGYGQQGQGHIQGQGRRVMKGELLPCSIRCPGMTGEIPTLQCKRCLCLYHPGCLGLPNNPYRNFYCANCEDSGQGQGQGQGSGGHGHGQRGGPPLLIQLPKKRLPLPKIPNLAQFRGGNMNLNPPPLIRPGMGHILRQGSGGASLGPNALPRGMRLPHGLMGQGGHGHGLSSRSVTITPISFPPRGQGQRGQGHGQGSKPKFMLSPTGGLVRTSGGSVLRGRGRGRGPSIVARARGPGQQFEPVAGAGVGAVAGRGVGGFGRGRGRQLVNVIHRTRNVLPGLGPPGLKESSLFEMDGKTGRVAPKSGLPPKEEVNKAYMRYAVGLVTINQKKYLSLPKNSRGDPGSGSGSSSKSPSLSPNKSPAHGPKSPSPALKDGEEVVLSLGLPNGTGKGEKKPEACDSGSSDSEEGEEEAEEDGDFSILDEETLHKFLLKLFRYLPPAELGVMGKVCKSFAAAADELTPSPSSNSDSGPTINLNIASNANSH